MKKTKILIVEDELLIAENLAIKLKKLGHQVVDIVSSGKAAIKKASFHNPDLILMDIAIKGDLDGIQTANAIKETQNLAIIFLTAYADDKTLERASLTGCYGYILKPFKDRELHAAIKIALKKHQEQIIIQESLTEVTELLGEYSAQKSHIYEDELTKLPNQLMLRELFTYLLSTDSNSSSPDRSSPTEVKGEVKKKLLAFIYLKLDRFERIVSSLGNNQSDLLIKSVAKRLTEITNSFDYEGVTVRLGYNEFSILASGLPKRQIASNFAQQILDKLRQPFLINEQIIFVTASIGIAFYPFDSLTIERLLEQAKQAMLYTQDRGGHKYQLYTSAFRIMNSNVTSDLSLEADLHQALESNQLEIYYQPKINLKQGKILGAEALIRWNHPQLGIIAPNKILPVAEASGLMGDIGNWVLKNACNQIKIWQQNGLDFLRVAVNLSDYQLKQADLFHQLTQLLFELNIEPQSLELELTEQILVENVKANIQKLDLIKNLGIRISLDDFGTGYSSLSYLHQFPFDVLKIDRCFIKNIDRNQKNAVITKSIIEMAHQLGLKVVAEGIETQAELDFLIKHQCDEVQGYLFARPLPVKDFEKLLKSDFSLIDFLTELSLANN